MAFAPRRPLVSVPSRSIIVLIEAALIEGIPVGQSFRDLSVYIFHGFEDALAQKACVVLVAQFNGFMFAGGCAAGNDGPAHGAVGKKDFRFNSRIAA